MAAVNKTMNAKFDKEFWDKYYEAVFMRQPFVVFIPEKGKVTINTEIFKDIYGRSPLYEALPHFKLLNKLEKEYLENPNAKAKKRKHPHIP